MHTASSARRTYLGVAFGFRVHHHRLDAHLSTGTLDPQGDFAPVGNQDFLEHRRLGSIAARCARPAIWCATHVRVRT